MAACTNQNQLSIDMDLTPAQWLYECRRTIAKMRKNGFETAHIERAQERVFNSQKSKFMKGRG